jgi:pyroglutamyl-peptidase
VLTLHFGVSERAQGFVLETCGRNVANARLDASTALPSSALFNASGCETRTSTFPAERIALRLTRLGLPATLSTDAGAYLCNAVLYHSLGLASARACGPPRSAHKTGFIHIPARIPGSPAHREVERDEAERWGLTWRQALGGSLEIIAVSVADLGRR